MQLIVIGLEPISEPQDGAFGLAVLPSSARQVPVFMIFQGIDNDSLFIRASDSAYSGLRKGKCDDRLPQSLGRKG